MRLSEIALRPDRPAGTEEPEGLEALVWVAQLILREPFLGYRPRIGTAHNVRQLQRNLDTYLCKPPKLDEAETCRLIEVALAKRPSVAVAATLVAAVIVGESRPAEAGQLAVELESEYWQYRAGLRTLGLCAASTLDPQTDAMEHPAHVRAVLDLYAGTALDFVNETSALRALMDPSTASPSEAETIAVVARILDADWASAPRFGRRDGESSTELVRRALRHYEEGERLRKMATRT